MSFLYARKLDDRVYVLADSKISYDTIENDVIVKAIGKENEYLLRNYGLVKNVIINKDICVGFAGSIRDFNELLKYIDDNNMTETSNINKKALEIHLKNEQETDFIIAQCNTNIKSLYVIKNGELLECDSCWIGSAECFNKFQEERYKLPNVIVFDIESKSDVELEDDLNKWINDESTFENIVNEKIDDTVGLFTIRCLGNENGFKYCDELNTFAGFRDYEIKEGEAVTLYENTANGGYTYYIYESNNYAGMYIYQLNKGIVFKPCINHVEYNHLRFPTLEETTEEKFIEKYKFRRPFGKFI